MYITEGRDPDVVVKATSAERHCFGSAGARTAHPSGGNVRIAHGLGRPARYARQMAQAIGTEQFYDEFHARHPTGTAPLGELPDLLGPVLAGASPEQVEAARGFSRPHADRISQTRACICILSP